MNIFSVIYAADLCVFPRLEEKEVRTYRTGEGSERPWVLQSQGDIESSLFLEVGVKLAGVGLVGAFAARFVPRQSLSTCYGSWLSRSSRRPSACFPKRAPSPPPRCRRCHRRIDTLPRLLFVSAFQEKP